MKSSSPQHCCCTRFSLGLFISIACVLPETMAGETQDASEILSASDRQFEAGNYEAVANLLEKALDTGPPDSVESLFLLEQFRRACERTWAGERFVAAIKRRLIRVESAGGSKAGRRELRMGLLKALAAFYTDQQQPAEAISALEQIRSISPGRPSDETDSRLLDLYEEAGQYRKAAVLLEARLATDPGNPVLKEKLARHYLCLGNLHRGLELLEVRNSPFQAFSMANQLFESKLLKEAETLARILAEQNPDAKFLLAEIYAEQKRFEVAKKLMDECYALEMRPWVLSEMVEKIAELHDLQGDLQGLAEEKLGELEELPALDIPGRRKLYLLLSQIEEQLENPVAATRYFSKYRELLDRKREGDEHLAELAQSAVRKLLAEKKLQEAETLLANIRADGFQHARLDCADYFLLLERGDAEGAGILLDRLLAKSAEDTHWSFELAVAFTFSPKQEIAADLWRKLGEHPNEFAPFRVQAHIRLGEYCFERQDYVSAQKHFEVVDASLRAMEVSLLSGQEELAHMEIMTHFRLAKDEPSSLVKFLDDPRPERRLVAVKLLGQFGRLEHAFELLDRLPGADRDFRARLHEAINSIRARSVVAEISPPSRPDDDFLETLGKSGRVLWVEPDPFDAHIRFVALERKFVIRADMLTGNVSDFAETMEALCEQPLTAQTIAFAEDRIWVGTDHGLFAYHRKKGTWSGYAIRGELIDVPVYLVKIESDRVVVTFESEGRFRRCRFLPSTGEWKEEK